MIKILKKHKYKLLTLMLSIVSIFTLFIGISKTYAYEIDPNGNLTTSNLFPSNDIYTITSGQLNPTGVSVDLEYNQQYTFSLDPTGAYNKIVFYNPNGLGWILSSDYINNNGWTFTYTSILDGAEIGLYTDGPTNQTKVMLNQGSNVIPYEPYGTWYSSDNYNDLKNDYDTLEVNYGDLQDDYEELETNYSDLQDNYNDISNIGIYGDFYNCSVSVENTTLTFNQLIDNSLLVNNTIYFGKILNYLNLNNTDLKIIYINFNKRLNTNNINYTYWDDVSGIYFDLNMIDDNEEEYTTSYYNNVANPQIINGVMLNNDQVPTGNTTYDINNKIYDQMQFRYSRVLNDNVGLSSSTLYIQGYNVGYNAGTSTKNESYEDRIDVLNNRVNDLEEANQMQYDAGYQQGLNVGANQNLETAGMKTLFNSILSYPVNMIRSVFDFEFMGINITSLIMFIISIGIVAFVIKKFL